MNSNMENHSHHISQQFNAELEDVKNHMLENAQLYPHCATSLLRASV